MLVFIIRRGLQSVVVLVAMSLLVFVGVYAIGNPVDILINPQADQQDRERAIQALGLDKPLWAQYLSFLHGALTGDLGRSFVHSTSALGLILERMPATLELSFCAAMFAMLVGIPMGVYTGLYPRHWTSRLFQAVSLIGISLPTFLIGILLILVFSVTLHWLPSFGRGETVQIGWWTTNFLTVKGLEALILPSITLGLFQLTLLMRLVRSEMLEVMRTDYIKFARARGLTNRAINFGHALKNTLVPVITVTGLQLGSLIAFAIVTETVFAWPGVGQLFIQSVQFSDIPVMAAYLLLIGLLFVVINLVVDLLYFVVDPRLRSQGGAARVSGH
jgi:peptide/nickel transport system permease protein